MTTHTIETTTGQNVGQAVLTYLKENKLYGRVEVKTIHTTRNCRTKTTIINTKPKLS